MPPYWSVDSFSGYSPSGLSPCCSVICPGRHLISGSNHVLRTWTGQEGENPPCWLEAPRTNEGQEEQVPIGRTHQEEASFLHVESIHARGIRGLPWRLARAKSLS